MSVLYFVDWLQSQGEKPDFESVSAIRLNSYLCRYYKYQAICPTEASPMLDYFVLELNRYLRGPPFYRKINIITNPEFGTSNRILNASTGTGSNLQAAEFGVDFQEVTSAVTFTHLHKLYMHEILSGNDHFSLQNKVWVDINLFFGGFTRQLIRDMTKSSFKVFEDTNECRRYYKLVDHRISRHSETRMYEQPGSEFCPVSSLERYISLLHPESEALFQQPCSNEDVQKNGTLYWSQPIGKNHHSGKLSSLCKHIGVYSQFRNTSVRHLSRHISSVLPDYLPAYSDKIFRILIGTENDPMAPNLSH